MTKKYFNLSVVPRRLSTTKHQPTMQMRLSLGLQPNVFESKSDVGVPVKVKGLKTIKQYQVNTLGKSHMGKVKVATAVGTLLMLQGMMLTPANAATASKTGQRVLMIEMTPALCSLQPTRSRMRQCLEGYSLTVSGLDMGYGERCGRGSEPRLTPLQLKVVNRIMPDTTVRTQAWQRYGACSPLSSSSYFRQITNYAGALKLPKELNTGNSYTVLKSRFIGQMTSLNKGMSPASIDLICHAGSQRQMILTDVHVCYEGSSFANCHNVVDNCGSKFVISGGK